MSRPAWDWTLTTVFVVIFLAQLPGKSALTALVLSSRYRLLPVLSGAALALAAHSLIAVMAGGLLSLLPTRPVHVVAGIAFVVSAVLMWQRSTAAGASEAETSKPDHDLSFAGTFGTTLIAIFVAEWGDLTQLCTAALAARYRSPLVVLIGAVLGLWTATGIAILVGKILGRVLKPELTQRVAALVFAGLGAALVCGII